jgi:hypothetical protein
MLITKGGNRNLLKQVLLLNANLFLGTEMTALLGHGVFLLLVAANTSRGKLQFRLKQDTVSH